MNNTGDKCERHYLSMQICIGKSGQQVHLVKDRFPLPED